MLPFYSLLLRIKVPSSLPYHFHPSFCSLTYRTLKYSRGSQDCTEENRLVISPCIVQSTILNCQSDVIALSFFLRCAKQPNYFHDYRTFGLMVNVLERLRNQFITVRGILEELSSVGCVTKPQTFLLLLRIFWRGNMYQMVFEAFEEMDRYGYTCNTFAHNVVIDVLFKIGLVDRALAVMRETKVPNFLTYSIALCNLCKSSDLFNLQNVFRVMLRRRYLFNMKTFEMAIKCFSKGGMLAQAFQLLGLMITLGFPVSENIWSLLIIGFIGVGRVHIASNLLSKMIEAGCSPNVVIYTSLIKGFMESHNVSSAFAILGSMKSKGCKPDLILCNMLIDCFSKLGRYDDAFDVFVSMPKLKLKPDSYTFTSMLSAMWMSQQFSLLPQMASRLVVVADLVLCNSLLTFFLKAGFPSLAVEFYNDMIERGFKPDQYTFVGLLRGLFGMGRIDEAVNVYRWIIINHSGHDAHVHSVVISCLIKAGRFHEAIHVIRQAVMEKYPLDNVAYTIAIRGLLKCGFIEEAGNLYSLIKEVFPG